jgi:hypothetical protein
MVNILSAATPDKYKMVQAGLENCSQPGQRLITIQVRTASYRVLGLLLCEHHQYKESIMAKGQQKKNKEAKKPKKKPTPAI